MQQEPMRSPANEDQNQEGDFDSLLTPAQEAAMLSEYGASTDDSSFNLQDPDSEEQEPKSSNKSEQKANQNFDKNLPITQFHNHYVGYMDLFADQRAVMKYLDAHQGWFRRCAHPFKADPIGETGYAMGVGQVGAIGFKVDPRVGLNLLPPDQNSIYRITTIPIPDQAPQGYEVDFHAEMRLQEKVLDFKTAENPNENAVMTCIEWDLNLTVSLQFPAFIQRVSKDVIQKTGDNVLGFVVQRVSKSLTPKVQADFHKTHAITIPKQIKLRK